MNIDEIIKWSQEKIKGKFFKIFLAICITALFTSISFKYTKTTHISANQSSYITFSIGLGFLFYFVNIGLTKYLINFITDKEYKLKDLFSEYKRFFELLVAGLIRDIYLLLYTLLLIVPGIKKFFGYSLYNFLLLDDKYKNLSKRELLKLSEKMMDGHKMQLLNLVWFHFIGWYLLAVFTLGILAVWVIPLQMVASNKFLLEVKNEYEQNYIKNKNL